MSKQNLYNNSQARSFEDCAQEILSKISIYEGADCRLGMSNFNYPSKSEEDFEYQRECDFYKTKLRELKHSLFLLVKEHLEEGEQ
jgi:hypothetical protein